MLRPLIRRAVLGLPVGAERDGDIGRSGMSRMAGWAG
jgi:hypothetical protein